MLKSCRILKLSVVNCLTKRRVQDNY